MTRFERKGKTRVVCIDDDRRRPWVGRESKKRKKRDLVSRFDLGIRGDGIGGTRHREERRTVIREEDEPTAASSSSSEYASRPVGWIDEGCVS